MSSEPEREDIGTVLVPTGEFDGDWAVTRRMPIAQFVAMVIADQRALHQRQVEDCVRQIEGFNVPDDIKAQALEFAFDLLARELARFEREITALAARGMRVNETLQ